MFIGQGIIKTPRIEEVLTLVNRANFTKNDPQVDSPQPIGYGVTISAPHMVSGDNSPLLVIIINSML